MSAKPCDFRDQMIAASLKPAGETDNVYGALFAFLISAIS